MFGIGIPELIIIFVIALIVLGPDKLPQLARQLAHLIAELKKAGEDFKSQMDIEALKEIKHPKEMLREALETKDTSGSHDAPQGMTPETQSEKQTGESASKPDGSRPDVN